MPEPDLCSYGLCPGPGWHCVCSGCAERAARARGSELRIPAGGHLWLYVPGVLRAGACAGRGCAQLTAASAPRSGVYTSPEFDGAGARPLPPAICSPSLPLVQQASLHAGLPARPVFSQSCDVQTLHRVRVWQAWRERAASRAGPEVVLEYRDARQSEGAQGAPVLRILHVMQARSDASPPSHSAQMVSAHHRVHRSQGLARFRCTGAARPASGRRSAGAGAPTTLRRGAPRRGLAATWRTCRPARRPRGGAWRRRRPPRPRRRARSSTWPALRGRRT